MSLSSSTFWPVEIPSDSPLQPPPPLSPYKKGFRAEQSRARIPLLTSIYRSENLIFIFFPPSFFFFLSVLLTDKSVRVTLFFSLWTKQQHQQQRGVHMWCVPVVAAAAAFSLCIINCRTPVVIDTCARHGSNRRGERWEATREEEKNDVRPVCIAVPLSCCDLWTWSCVRTSDIYLCCFVFIE